MKRLMWIALCLFLISCTPGSGTRSASYLVIDFITNPAGQAIITSDVLTNNSVFEDYGNISVTAHLYDPYPTFGTSAYNDVIVDQLDIEYLRSDGKNVQGKDVPYSYSLPVDQRVNVDTSSIIVAVMVRHIAKLEPPLIDLVDLSQETILYLNCKVTAHSKDMAGKRLKPVSGYIQIQCANFAD